MIFFHLPETHTSLLQRSALIMLAIVAVPLLATACGDDGVGTGINDPVAVIEANPTSVPAGDGNQTVVTLDGSGSSDPESDPLTFSWTVPSGTFVNGTTASSEIAQVTFPGTKNYVVTLTVGDGNGESTAQVTIEIS